MTIIQQQIDPAIVSRVKKLLALARDGGASEAEANLAMQRAQEVMLANNLSIAQVDASGTGGAEARLKDGLKKKASFHWQRELMAEIAKSCFCHLDVTTERRAIRYGATRELHTGYELIGRVSNVTTAKQMYEYLLHTIERLRSDYGGTPRDGALFVEGLAFRLRDRVRDRHARALREQREKAKAQAASASTANALVVILEDYAVAERELNEDLRDGRPPGTTTKRRLESEAKERANQARIAKLKTEGMDSNVAYFVVYLNWSVEKAEAWMKAHQAAAKPSSAGRTRYRRTHEDRVQDRMAERSRSAQWRDGESAAEDVGLDDQIGNKARDTKRLS